MKVSGGLVATNVRKCWHSVYFKKATASLERPPRPPPKTAMKLNHALSLYSTLLFLCKCIDAVLINTTIDDKFGDPTTGRAITYSPASAWNDGANCDHCSAHPDEDSFYMHTWKDSTSNSNFGIPTTVSVKFTGTAVYVLCALSHSKSLPSGNSDMSFFIDNRLAGTFTREAPGDAGYDYNVTVFAQTNLPSMEHTIRIQNGHPNGPPTLILLDAIIYTQDDGTSKSEPSSINAAPTTDPSGIHASSESSSTSGTVIIAAVIGSTGGVTLVILLYLLYHRFRRASSTQTTVTAPERLSPPSQSYTTTPFVYEGSSSPAVAPSSVHEKEAPPPYGYPQGKS